MKITRDHIIKYLKGELPHFELHEFEKMILEDPFLSDALEGLQEIDDPEIIAEAISEIEHQIEEKYGKVRNLVPIYRNPVAIAAAVSLLVLSVAVIFLIPDYREKVQSMLTSKEDTLQVEGVEDTLMNNKNEKSLPFETPSDDSIAMDTTDQIIQELIPVTPLAEQNEEQIDTSREEPMDFAQAEEDTGDTGDDVEGEGDFLADEEITAEDFALEDTTEIAAENQPSDIAAVPQEVITRGNEGNISSAQRPEANEARMARAPVEAELDAGIKTVSGIVTSADDNQPLPGVNVMIKGTSRGTITDISGSYSLQLRQDENELEYSFIGFEPSEITIQDEGTYNVSLNSDVQQLSEVVVVGYGANRSEAIDRYASPSSGRINYNRYLRDNMVYPDEAAQNEVNGRVLVEFTVTAQGTFNDFEIIRSLGFGCDEETIRLVREGPAWEPAISDGVPVDERVRVSVRFKPPTD